MKLEGMVGHKMGLAAIYGKFWFFQNGGILHAKITFLSISQELFDRFCSFFIKMCQIINEISTSTSFHTNYAINEEFMLRRAQNQTRWQSKNWVFAFFSKSVHLIFLIFGMKLEGMAGHKMGLAAISRKLWFFHNCGILRAKITFSSISQEPFDRFCSFFTEIISYNKWSKYIYQFLHKLCYKRGIHALACLGE